MPGPQASINANAFRQILGQYPTGVCVITALMPDEHLSGMVVGSFVSVSLDPPLVGFFPDKASGSWGRLQGVERFCVNIVAADQEALCRRLASRDPDKFADVRHRPSPNGTPILEGAVAWIECEMHSIGEAGDHYFVMGLVSNLEMGAGGLPLLFFQGGYGRFLPSSLVASDTQGLLTGQLRVVDLARPEMERLASDLSVQCLASIRVGDEVIIAASAGNTGSAATFTMVGQRLPFLAPTGSVLVAWAQTDQIERWLGPRTDSARRDRCRASLARVRERGFSVSLLNDAQRSFARKLQERAASEAVTPPSDLVPLVQDLESDPATLSPDVCEAVTFISAPVFDPSEKAVLALYLTGFPRTAEPGRIAMLAGRLIEGADRLTERLGGRKPGT